MKIIDNQKNTCKIAPVKRDIYYKFRGISKFEYIEDIILKERLFASFYYENNDTSEGFYYPADGLSIIEKRKIKELKTSVRFCSTSKLNKSPLLWAYYAESHNGVVFGVEVIKNNKYKIAEIKYKGLVNINNFTNDTITKILSHKKKCWRHEKEVRIYKIMDDESDFYINIKIKEIIFGSRLTIENKIKICNLIDFHRNPDICIYEENGEIFNRQLNPLSKENIHE